MKKGKFKIQGIISLSFYLAGIVLVVFELTILGFITIAIAFIFFFWIFRSVEKESHKEYIEEVKKEEENL